MPRIQIQVARREADPDNADPLVVGFLGGDFTCRSSMNQWTMLEMLAADADDLGEVMSAFMAFLREVIVPDDWDRFRKHCRAQRVGVEDLQPLVQQIAEFYAATPGLPSSASSVGSSTTGNGSRDAVSPAAAYQLS